MTNSSRSTASSTLAVLRTLGLVPAGEGWSLQPLSRNRERMEAAAVQYHVLSNDGQPRQIVCVGRDLADLAQRSRLFGSAYPDLACAVQGEGRHLGLHYLLLEYFAGRPAIDILHQTVDGPARVLAALNKIDERFRAAETPSTAEAARAELAEHFNELLALPYWTALDRAYLESSVIPYLQEQLIPLHPTRRVSNGDLLLRNILLNDAGEARIIDYEHSLDTHFHREDWFRLGYWDVVPESLRSLLLSRIGQAAPQRVYFALKQIVLEARTSLPQKAAADLPHWTGSIRQVITRAISGRQSLFWPSGELETEFRQDELQAQLYWMTDEGWSAERSALAVVRTGPHQTVHFQIPAGPAVHALRFDPLNCPGIATIFNVTVRKLDPTPTVTYSAYGPQALAFVVPAGDAIAGPAGGELFQIICTGSDPQLHFNQAGGPAGSRLEVEVTFSLSVDPVDQIALLRKLATAGKLARTEPAASATGADRTGEIAALAAQLHQWFTGEQGLQARLMAEFARQRRQEQAEQATASKLTITQAALDERTEDLRQLREQLTGYATTIDRLELALAAANAQAVELTRLREESLGHQLAAHDNAGRLAQELAAANERVRLLEAELASLRQRGKGWFGR